MGNVIVNLQSFNLYLTKKFDGQANNTWGWLVRLTSNFC